MDAGGRRLVVIWLEVGGWSWRLVVANDDVVVIRLEAGRWSWRLVVANDDVVVIR